MPTVSFLMPVASPAPFIESTLHSLNSQTYRDWDLVLVVDGLAPEVVDEATRIIDSSRLRIVQRDQRGGIAKALNDGLRECRGKYVARIDADDVCYEARLQRQVELLDSTQDLVLVGSSAMIIDQFGKHIGFRKAPLLGQSPEALIRRNRFIHSSVTFKREVADLAGGYDESCHLREDYELWLRLARHGRLENIVQPLVEYRVSDSQISRGRPGARSLRVVRNQQRRLGTHLRKPRPVVEYHVRLWSLSQTAAVLKLSAVRRRIAAIATARTKGSA